MTNLVASTKAMVRDVLQPAENPPLVTRTLRRTLVLISVCVASFARCKDSNSVPQAVYTLTIQFTSGVSGTPSAGVHNYPSGTHVPYAFVPRPGNENVAVSLDGVPKPSIGSLTMDSNVTLMVTADSIVVVASVDRPMVVDFEKLLTDPSPMPAFRMLQAELAQVLAGTWTTDPNTGRNEAEERVRAALVAAYDPVEDAAALRRVLREIRDSLSRRPAGSAHANRPSFGGELTEHSTPTTASSISFLYVNGIWTARELAVTTREKFLEPIITAAGFSNRQDFPVYEVYNKTAAETNASEEIWICLNLKADLILLGRISSGSNLSECFTRIASALWLGDLAESVQQLVNRTFSALPQEARNDAVRLADRIVEELAKNGRVIVVAHSQGNLMLTEALQFVSVFRPQTDLGCVGVVAIAPPASVLHARYPPRQMIIRGTRTADILAQFLPSTLGVPTVTNDLSDAYDLALAGAPLIPLWKDKIRTVQGLKLHEINASYLGELRTKNGVIAAVASQASTVLANCAPAPAISLAPTSLHFAGVEGQQSNPPAQFVTVQNSGGGTLSGLSWGAAVQGPRAWLLIELAGTSAPTTLKLSPLVQGMPAGNYSGQVNVNSSVAINSPQILDVTLSVEPGGTGSLQITTSTTGQNPDPDGYVVTVDGGQNEVIGSNASVTLHNLVPGARTVELTGVASNCSVEQNPRVVTVVPSGTAQTTFNVSCGSALSGTLQVTTETTGQATDPDGYLVGLDGVQSRAIGINGSVTFTGVSTGGHTVALSGIAGNCTVSGGTLRTVTVPADGVATVLYAVSCTAATGELTVTTSTSGASLDPDGYTVTIDGASSQAIAINGSVSFTGLTAGGHAVVLADVASNCSVNGGKSRTVIVPAGGSMQESFQVSCTAVTPPTTDVTGQWAGEKSDNVTVGDLVLILRQDGGRVTGEFNLVDQPLQDPAIGIVEGLVSGQILSGHWSGAYLSTDCKLEIDFTGIVDDFVAGFPGDDRIQGSYSGTNSCTGAITNGRFIAFKTL